MDSKIESKFAFILDGVWYSKIIRRCVPIAKTSGLFYCYLLGDQSISRINAKLHRAGGMIFSLRKQVMSWAKSFTLISLSLTIMPLILSSCRIWQASISRANVNSKGDKGCPCLTPQQTENKSLVNRPGVSFQAGGRTPDTTSGCLTCYVR